ncbi:MAG TPA: molybdopterin cofactor-binding domain-containing protein [Gemmatimonadales bacterium]|nr:molybdopterin cofactor-binding domain-containing protein [Gemmatimonadales bacterium]
MPAGSNMDRREFLAAAGAGSLVFAVGAGGCSRVDDSRPAADTKPTLTITPVAHVRLDDTGSVTVVCHRSEMGQGIRTTMAMVIADELEADWDRVVVDQAPGDEKLYGSQNTDGSTSIRDFLPQYRETGATVRLLLEAAAAQQWNVPIEEVEARMHEVLHRPSGRTLAYGKLVAAAKDLPIPPKDQLKLKDPSRFRYIGKEIPIVDLSPMITGRAVYGQDLRRNGMKIAVIARPPVWGAKIGSVDSAEAESVPGVERVVRLPEAVPPSGYQPLGGVAIVAQNTWAAIQGRRKLKIEWNHGPNGRYDSTTYRSDLERTARKPGKVVREQGNVRSALARSAKRMEAEYYIAHLVHAQMEPPAALAVFDNGRLEAWACTQDPQTARNTIAETLKIPVEQVAVHVSLLGGGFGRKSKPDFIVEAALLAREMGAPVKVVWTREDDIQHGYYHTVAAERLEAGLDENGKVTGWLHRSVLPSIGATFAPNVLAQAEFEAGMGLTDFPYATAAYRAEVGPAPARTRIGWYRSVINIPHGFAIGSFIDELAHAAGQDSKTFLLELLGPDRLIDPAKEGVAGKPWNYGQTFENHPIDVARYRHVVELAAAKAGWGQPLPTGHGRGISVHRSFLSYVAAVVQVAVRPDGGITIPRVDVAVDAGFIAHPERARAQMEGAAIMGLGNALYGEISFKDGRVVQSNYGDYRVMRMNAAPRAIHVHLVPSDKPPGGIGEPGVPPIAPALANAVFAATGRRIRSLPVAGQLAPATA